MDEDERELIEAMIGDLVNLEDGLSEWEVEFVESLSHQNAERLTQKQIDKVKELHEKHV